jgi:non-ribosomal peptide synthetase component F
MSKEGFRGLCYASPGTRFSSELEWHLGLADLRKDRVLRALLEIQTLKVTHRINLSLVVPLRLYVAFQQARAAANTRSSWSDSLQCS